MKRFDSPLFGVLIVLCGVSDVLSTSTTDMSMMDTNTTMSYCEMYCLMSYYFDNTTEAMTSDSSTMSMDESSPSTADDMSTEEMVTDMCICFDYFYENTSEANIGGDDVTDPAENAVTENDGVTVTNEMGDSTEESENEGVTDGSENEGVTDGSENEGVTDGNENEGVTDGNENEGVTDGSENGVTDGNENEGVTDGSENGVTDGNENGGVTDSSENEGVTDGSQMGGSTEGDEGDGVTDGSNENNEGGVTDSSQEGTTENEDDDEQTTSSTTTTTVATTTTTTTPPPQDDTETFADESEELDVEPENVASVAQAVGSIDENIQTSSLTEISAEILADTAVLLQLAESDASDSVLSYALLAASGVLSQGSITDANYQAYQVACASFSEEYINGLSNDDIDRIIDNEGPCEAYESPNTLVYYANNIASRIAPDGATKADIHTNLEKYICYLVGLTGAQWDAILTEYAATGEADADDLDEFTDSVNENDDCGSAAAAAIAQFRAHFDQIEVTVDANIDAAVVVTLTTDDIAENIAGATAASVYSILAEAIEDTEGTEIEEAATSDQQPTAVLLQLKEYIDVTALDEDGVSGMAVAGGINARDVETIDTNTFCDAITSEDAVDGLYRAGALGSAYEKCKPVPFTVDDLASYGGLLVIGAPASDIQGLSDDVSDYMDIVRIFCTTSYDGAYLTRLQLAALGALAEAYFDENEATLADLEDFLCALPYASNIVTILSDMSDADDRKALCYELACLDIINLAMSEARGILQVCIQSGGLSFARLACPSKRDTMTLISAINADLLNWASSAELVRTIDNLQLKVGDCDARASLFNVLSAAGALVASRAGLSQIGTLLDQIEASSAVSWDAVAESERCGLQAPLFAQFGQQLAWLLERTNAGTTTTGLECFDLTNDRDLANLRTLITPDSCSGTAERRRRKRAIEIIGCSDIVEAGSLVPYMYSAASLSTLSVSDFQACAEHLGSIHAFDEEQLEALAYEAVQAFGEPSNWTEAEILVLGPIVSGLSMAEIEGLTGLSSLDAIFAVGWSGVWTSSKLTAAFTAMLGGDEVSALTGTELAAMGALACGMSAAQIAQLDAGDAFCASAFYVGQQLYCDSDQLAAFAALAMHADCSGPNVDTWETWEINNIGAIIGGLSEDDFAALDRNQLQTINPIYIQTIPADNFAALSSAQLGYFSALQLGQMTSAQYNGLSSEQQEAVQNALGDLADDVDLDTSVEDDDDDGCGMLEASLLWMVTSVLAALLKI